MKGFKPADDAEILQKLEWGAGQAGFSTDINPNECARLLELLEAGGAAKDRVEELEELSVRGRHLSDARIAALRAALAPLPAILPGSAYLLDEAIAQLRRQSGWIVTATETPTIDEVR